MTPTPTPTPARPALDAMAEEKSEHQFVETGKQAYQVCERCGAFADGDQRPCVKPTQAVSAFINTLTRKDLAFIEDLQRPLDRECWGQAFQTADGFDRIDEVRSRAHAIIEDLRSALRSLADMRGACESALQELDSDHIAPVRRSRAMNVLRAALARSAP